MQTIQEMHRDHVPVESIPASSDLQIIASSEVSPNQGMVKFYPATSSSDPPAASNPTSPPNSPATDSQPPQGTQPTPEGKIHILTIQGHPEFTQPIVSSIVAQRAAAGVMSPQISSDMQGRVAEGWDERARADMEGVVGRVLWGVVEGKV
ncbi:hypothetical protein CVT26_013766 [Gymnopilus dilepis]|uniref:Glutamine amidotransferase domain-containing protein n=1 Tax=Gymnopilus dilepis TaxID=231916 RepID=A0A409Y6B8_9AGAR|nr:hypothetical protein CVT26_013766 [Gymnopilus dilepis]